MTRTKITNEQRAEIFRQVALLHANGKSLSAAAEHIGRDRSTVLCLVRDYPDEWKAAYDQAVGLIGEVKHRRGTRVKTESIDEAAKLHAEGKTWGEIAAHFGVTVSTVAAWRLNNRQRWDTAFLSASSLDPPTPLPVMPTDPTKSARTLWAIAQQMFVRKANITKQQTIKHYCYALNNFGKYLGRVATEVDLTDDVLIGWMASEQRRVDSVSTVRSYVERVRSIWRFVSDRGEIATRPSFSLPPIPEPTPIALDESQIRRLFESALCRPGFVCGVPARYWWPAIFGFAFCTSERKSAVMALRWDWLDLTTGSVSIPAVVRKGGLKSATYRLWPEAIWLLKRIEQPSRELVFPWEMSDAGFYNHYGRILVDAQIPDDRKHKLHSLRVTHNTWTKVFTGKHSPLLMHTSQATSERHYEDKRFTVVAPVKLPIPWAAQPAENALRVGGDESTAKLPRAKALKGGAA